MNKTQETIIEYIRWNNNNSLRRRSSRKAHIYPFILSRTNQADDGEFCEENNKGSNRIDRGKSKDVVKEYFEGVAKIKHSGHGFVLIFS